MKSYQLAKEEEWRFRDPGEDEAKMLQHLTTLTPFFVFLFWEK